MQIFIGLASGFCLTAISAIIEIVALTGRMEFPKGELGEALPALAGGCFSWGLFTLVFFTIQATRVLQNETTAVK